MQIFPSSNTNAHQMAIKVISKHGEASMDAKFHTRIQREAALLKLSHHPNIISVHDMISIDDYYYLFSEYVNGGQMLDYIISHGKLKEKVARRYFRQIVSAVGTLLAAPVNHPLRH